MGRAKPLTMNAEAGRDTDRKVRKQRIPKACSECRRSKLKCDAQRPCSRCRVSKKTCHYYEPVNDADKIKALQAKVELLKAQIQDPTQFKGQPKTTADYSLEQTLPLAAVPTPFLNQDDTSLYQPLFPPGFPPIGPFNHLDWASLDLFAGAPEELPRHLDPNVPPDLSPQPPNHLKAPHANVNELLNLDFVTSGMLTKEQAEPFIGAFFRGCGRYFPFADPAQNSMRRVREQSILLFNTMCAMGCRARQGHHSQLWKVLDVHVSRMLDTYTITGIPTIETIQALLIRACYSTERSLIMSMATRMAYEIGLQGAYDELKKQIVLGRAQAGPAESLESSNLPQKLRTWLSILILRLMLGIDTGTSLDPSLYGDVRRYRIILDKPFTTELDLCLLEQMELNVLMAKIHNSVTDVTRNVEDDKLIEAVQDARVDIEVWFNDWTYILNSKPHEDWLSVNIKVQRHWADVTMLCWAVCSLNVGSLDVMSPAQKKVLMMAKSALQQHLGTILAEPQVYIHNLRYATDYVWAKFVFSFLLLLELSGLTLEDGDEAENPKQDLLRQGHALFEELSRAGGIIGGETCSDISQDYLELLRNGIESFSQLVSEDSNDPSRAHGSPGDHLASGTPGRRLKASLAPSRIALEWRFPLLGLQSGQSEIW